MLEKVKHMNDSEKAAALWYCGGDEEEVSSVSVCWDGGDWAEIMNLYNHREIVEMNERLTEYAAHDATETLVNLYDEEAHIYYNADGDCIAYGYNDPDGFYTVYPCDDAEKAFRKLSKIGYIF